MDAGSTPAGSTKTMSKASATAFSRLDELVEQGKTVQIEKLHSGYEVTVWPKRGELDHHHYFGETLLEAILKIK